MRSEPLRVGESFHLNTHPGMVSSRYVRRKVEHYQCLFHSGVRTWETLTPPEDQLDPKQLNYDKCKITFDACLMILLHKNHYTNALKENKKAVERRQPQKSAFASHFQVQNVAHQTPF